MPPFSDVLTKAQREAALDQTVLGESRENAGPPFVVTSMLINDVIVWFAPLVVAVPDTDANTDSSAHDRKSTWYPAIGAGVLDAVDALEEFVALPLMDRRLNQFRHCRLAGVSTN